MSKRRVVNETNKLIHIFIDWNKGTQFIKNQILDFDISRTKITKMFDDDFL